MDCKEFRNRIDDYLDDRMSLEELNEFLDHRNNCADCAEELEISYIVREGVLILDEKSGDYNIGQHYRTQLSRTEQELSRQKRIIAIRYVTDTLAFWGVIFAAFSCLRMIAGI